MTVPFDPTRLVLGDVLARQARAHGGEPFLKFREGEVTYREVDLSADRLAQGLAAHGVGPGDHVAFALPNVAELVVLVFALARLGAVAVPLSTEYKGRMLEQVLEGTGSTVAVVHSRFVDAFAAVAPGLPGLRLAAILGERLTPAESDHLGCAAVAYPSLLGHGDDRPRARVAFSDLQAIMPTSGTTGPSKGAMVPHALPLTCAIDSLRFVSGGSRTIYCPLPLFHAAGLWDGMMSALVSGASVAIVERFSASRFWEDVRAFGAQTAMGVFSMIPILLGRPAAPDDSDNPLETFYMGKSSLDAAFHRRFGAHTVETYTSTEAGIATASPYGEWRTGSMGRAHAERFEVAVVDDHDRALPPGEAGELVLRPRQPSVIISGYYGRPDATAECFRNLWFHTGDRAYADSEGYFYFVDRKKDAIRRRGENISTFDLECEINLHPEVLECAAVGVPSELEEEEVKLVVVRQPGADLDEAALAAYCSDRLPAFMVPRYFDFADELPRTATGKIAKHLLRTG